MRSKASGGVAPRDVLGEPGFEVRLVDSLVGHGRQSYAVGSVITAGCWSTSVACSPPRSGTASRTSAGTRAWRRTRCCACFGEDPAALAELRELETGRISEDEFERRFAERLGLDDATDLIDSMFRGMKPSEPMVAAVRAARAGGVHTGLVSNSWSTSHYDRDLLAELFDAAVISAEVGLHKPQPEIYLLASQRLGVEPGRCVFVDDLRENCAGAEAVGMTAILHRDVAATVARLEELLGFTVPA